MPWTYRTRGLLPRFGTVIGFDKTFILQAIAFVIVIPLLLFLRVKRTPPASVPAARDAAPADVPLPMHLE